MKKYIFSFLICIGFSVNGFCQNDAQEVYFMKASDGFHYINNDINYTMKFLGENVEYLEGGSFKIQDHIIRLIEVDYDTLLYHNGKSIEAEKRVLEAFKDQQLTFFKEDNDHKVKVKEDYFFNKEGKRFYLFTVDIPLDKVNTAEDYLRKMNILCFVVNDKLSTMSFPLFKSEDEAEKAAYIKELTESVAIFPSKIDIEFLRRRILNKNDEDLVVNLENEHFQFTVPDYLNVIKSNDPTIWSASFPEVNNIKNAVVIRMVEKEEYESLETFNKEIFPQGKIDEEDDRIKVLLKEELENIGEINGKSMRLQYMPKGTMRLYHAKKLTFETKTHYVMVIFNATTDTYAVNIDRFDAFLETFKIQME